MVRAFLLLLLLTALARAVWRLLMGVMRGAAKPPGAPGRPGAPARGVQMVRDPVCGTFVVPSRALTLGDGPARVYFCSEDCRAQYRARAR
ncbi:MAG TPA: hypothetical protein VND92_09230 [Vicinamibacterales bacterium]|nr:hypothetical protein [Vicinamibacterales bacterium]